MKGSKSYMHTHGHGNGHSGNYNRRNNMSLNGNFSNNTNSYVYGNNNSTKPKYKSGFGLSQGKSPAPQLTQFYNPKYHKPKESGDADLCQAWQSDSCILPKGQNCSKWHKCKWCGGKHPGDMCRNK